MKRSRFTDQQIAFALQQTRRSAPAIPLLAPSGVDRSQSGLNTD